MQLIDLDARSKAQMGNQALDILRATDVLALRYLERGSVPVELRVYREALREVVRGKETTLPAAPALPTLSA